MIQGDEPMTHPDMISHALQPMIDDKKIEVVNLLGKIKSIEEFNDKNCIKVVCDKNQNALYFSRQPIPNNDKCGNILMKKQVCIIPFRRDFLIEYTSLSPTELEVQESIDMLRVLEHGKSVHMVETDFESYAVDTPDDIKRVENYLMDDNF